MAASQITRRALIVANGALPSRDRLLAAIADAEYVLAADGGANKLAASDLQCDAILGDFDSLTDGTLLGVARIPAPDQDATDLDKAVAYLISEGFDQIAITGATGDRLDHIFGALAVLVKYGRRVCLTLLDDIATAQLVGGHLELDTVPGQTVSLLPINAPQGVTTTGLRWNLSDEPLVAGQRDGTSNVATANRVTISVESGDLIVYAHAMSVS